MRPAASPLLINDAASSPPPALEQRPRAEEEPEEGRAPEGRPPHVADLVREPGDLIDRGAREETDETRRRSATEEEEEEEEEEERGDDASSARDDDRIWRERWGDRRDAGVGGTHVIHSLSRAVRRADGGADGGAEPRAGDHPVRAPLVEHRRRSARLGNDECDDGDDAFTNSPARRRDLRESPAAPRVDVKRRGTSPRRGRDPRSRP